MHETRDAEIAAILDEGKDLTVATLRPDGAPQATVVSYASDGVDVYFGCGAGSQKARNLARDGRVAMTVTLPYRDWAEIRGLSLSGIARRLTDPDELGRAGVLFLKKFPETAQYVNAADGELAMFKVTPRVASILDYAKGFGHTELVELGAKAEA